MKALEKLSSLAGKYMALVTLAVTALSLIRPGAMTWVKMSWVTPLLMVVMLGMGLTLKLSDIKACFLRPKAVLLQTALRFILCPLLAVGLSRLFRLSDELTLGMVILGACPGSTSAGVMTYLAGGNVALSVSLTAVSTILAPVLTPLLTLLFAGRTLDVSFFSMFLTIAKLIVIPVGLSLLLNKFLPRLTEKLRRIITLLSVIAIALIIRAVVSNNASQILGAGFSIIASIVAFNICGYIFGALLGKLLRCDRPQTLTLSIGTAMQNSGLATTLAVANFASMPMAAIPGAIFSVWCNVFGAVVAAIVSRRSKKAAEK